MILYVLFFDYRITFRIGHSLFKQTGYGRISVIDALGHTYIDRSFILLMIDSIVRRTPELADRLEQNVPYGQVARMP